jgi:hypothetical protein
VLVSAPPAEILQRGRTAVRIRRDGEVEQTVIRHSYSELPTLLQRYGLDPQVTCIELQEDSLETVIVEMIEEAEQ